MKAFVFSQYGKPTEALQLQEVAKPTPKENEVLVKVHATAVNDYDWSLVTGKPRIYRMLFGLTKPKRTIPGMELSGTVESNGTKASKFKPGDAVYGDISNHGFGTFAEYICLHEEALTLKPDKMSFEEAAAIPHASMLALQGLIDCGKLKQGEKILINGGGGGVGTFALQLAKLYGAEVTGVDTGYKLKMMQELGFDHIIDYKQTDFTKAGKRYDLILDAKNNRPPLAYLRALNPKGRYMVVGGEPGQLLRLLSMKPWISLYTGKKVYIVALKPNKDLQFINELYESGKLKCIIDGPYPFEESPRLIEYFGEGRHTGKVVVRVAD